MPNDQTLYPKRRSASDYLGRQFTIQVDRPLGSPHPVYGFIYPLNYGFIPGEIALDGEALDAYILGAGTALKQFSGICIAVIERLDDIEDKLVIAAPGQRFTQGEIRDLTSFQEQHFHTHIVLWDQGEKDAQPDAA